MMSTTHQDRDKSSGKPRQRNRKADRRGQKAGQQPDPVFDRRDEDQIDPVAATTDVPANDATVSAQVPLIGEVLQPAAASIFAAAPTDNDPISIQAIANAYRDYTR